MDAEALRKRHEAVELLTSGIPISEETREREEKIEALSFEEQKTLCEDALADIRKNAEEIVALAGEDVDLDELGKYRLIADHPNVWLALDFGGFNDDIDNFMGHTISMHSESFSCIDTTEVQIDRGIRIKAEDDLPPPSVRNLFDILDAQETFKVLRDATVLKYGEAPIVQE